MYRKTPKTEILFEDDIPDLSRFTDVKSSFENALTIPGSAVLSRKIKAFIGSSTKSMREVMDYIRPGALSGDFRPSFEWFEKHGFKVSAKNMTYAYPSKALVRFFVEVA